MDYEQLDKLVVRQLCRQCGKKPTMGQFCRCIYYTRANYKHTAQLIMKTINGKVIQ